ncbi:cobalamin biosynthesis protein CobG [Tropicibacter sp. S64]|uniref:cobalamin biosynthesis protein CobG n=1 Tax=Tropicibacter sp. S64 TaxID=3415122 RepID=UPI003C7A1DCD
MSAPPIVKGWCPGAHRPMMSGDGLVVRVRPFRAELTAAQALALCDLAERFGNGTLDLTSRANLQFRGVAEADHAALLAELDALGLIDADPAVEGHRNILMPPDWEQGDLTDRLYTALLDTLPRLPDLPEKMGFALDTGRGAHLRAGSADFRFERDNHGALLLRADGAARGHPVTEDTAMQALTEMADWFIATGGRDTGRMSRHLRQVALPGDWQTAAPRPDGVPLSPGPAPDGPILGAAFGKIDTHALRTLLTSSKATHLRLMLNRLFWLRGAQVTNAPGFVTKANDPALRAHACPGAPFCPQATVETRPLATRLARQTSKPLHVSGCAKGCALPRPCALTLTGRDGAFDLVENGAPWDAPSRTALDPTTLTLKDL